MTDIVERLLEVRGVLDNKWPGPSQMDKDAADEIKRLRKALDAAIHLISGLRDGCPADLLDAAYSDLEDRLKDLFLSDGKTP